MAKSEFEQIRNAQFNARNPQIAEGSHRLRVTKIARSPSRMPGKTHITNYLFEFEYVESTNPACKPGTPCAFIQGNDKMGWDGRVLNCLSAIYDDDLKANPKGADYIEDAFSEKQPLMGEEVCAVGSLVPGKVRKDGGPIVNVIFSPVAN